MAGSDGAVHPAHLRIVAVGHDAYRAGAQIAFLRMLRWIRDHDDADLRLVLETGGALEPDYRTVLPTTVLRPAASGPLARPDPGLGARLRRRLRPGAPLPAGAVPRGPADVVYANSVAAANLGATVAADLGCPLVLHVHELEMSIARFTAGQELREALARVNRFVAVSGAVAENLVRNHGVPAERITRVPGAIPIASSAPDPARRTRTRAEIGIPDDAFVVGGSGTVDWRKGPDVFLLVARAVQERAPDGSGPPIHFLWVGGEPRQLPMVEHDLHRLGLGATAHFIGPRADPAPVFEAFDAFFLSSREDPFPLVGLEAAGLGLPVVCYADAGGMPELVEDDAGVVVPYLDIGATATTLCALAGDPDTRARLGARAAAKVRERCAVDVVAPQIVAVLRDAAGAS
jgi:glycosyltransferase involved in cell wall biosynthesis